jgi:chitin disaccharide deacetylase
MTTTPLLIVNADDYGLTDGISAGILRAHRKGIVTSTSALATGPAFPRTAPWLLDEPSLGVGVHLAAVGEDPPLLSSAEIPSLVDKQGRLSSSYKGLVSRLILGAIDPADIEREFAAQLETVQNAGLAVTHLDAHQHLHLWPEVGAIVLSLARRYGIPSVRVTRSRRVTPVGLGVAVLGRSLARSACHAGMSHPSDAAGIDHAGQLDQSRLLHTLARLAAANAPSVELTVHPGEYHDPQRSRYQWGYRWPDELAALICPAVAAVARNSFRLGTYADLTFDPSTAATYLRRRSLVRRPVLHPMAGSYQRQLPGNWQPGGWDLVKDSRPAIGGSLSNRPVA